MAPNDLATEIGRLNRQEYDEAADLFWQWTVYNAVHGGWWLANIGGRRILEHGIRATAPHHESAILELCCGMGDACQYLVARTGCSATGIEINPRQVERAKFRALSRWSGSTHRVRFIEADALHWSPDNGYDLVLLIDALMLMPDERRVLLTAHRALAENGVFLSADVIAGPRIDERARRFARQEDGIINLPSAAERRRRFEEAGLEVVEWIDATRLAVRCFDRVERATRKHQRRLRPHKGPERYARWLRNASIYRHMFLRGRLGYLMALARVASGSPLSDRPL
jgi:SAM-dependent methyltransferase